MMTSPLDPTASLSLAALGIAGVWWLLRRRRAATDTSPATGLRQSPPTMPDSPSQVEELTKRVQALEQVVAEMSGVMLAALRQPDTPTNPSMPASAPATEPGTDDRTLSLTVYRLANAQATPSDIARQLGITQGEVELLLKLRSSPPQERAFTAGH